MCIDGLVDGLMDPSQAVFVIALLGLVDAGFSGDWQARGYLSDAAAGTARTACFTAAAAHVVLTAAAGFVAQAKGEGLAAAAITLAVSRKRNLDSSFIVGRRRE